MTASPLIIPMADIDCCGSIVPSPAPDDTTIVSNDGWFPDIALGDFREEMRIRASVTVPRQRKAVRDAIISIGNDLVDWAARQVAAGYTSLAVVPAPQIDGESRLELSYRSAIYAHAKAALVERYRDIDITDAGNRRAEDLEPSVGELRRDAIYAVRDILGVTRTAVELI